MPAREQTKAYRLLAEIMEEKGRAGIASFVMRERAYPVAIFAESGILRAETLRFADEIRTPKTLGLPRAAKPDAEARARDREGHRGARRARASQRASSATTSRERLLALARKKRARGEDVVEVAEEPAEPARGARRRGRRPGRAA